MIVLLLFALYALLATGVALLFGRTVAAADHRHDLEIAERRRARAGAVL